MIRRKGFSLTELMLAVGILGLLGVGFFQVFSTPGRGGPDAYLHSLALELAREPIEVLRAFGYVRLSTYEQHPIAKYPVNSGFHDIRDLPGHPDQHPPETAQFERQILLIPVEATGYRAMKILVQVRPRADSRVDKQWGGPPLTLPALVPEVPQ
jgi:prepilin-type N-terminal cleavage/methylation domain-containing protein